ncbi:MAG: polyprenyl synthetase family protein [Thermoplasmatales archaeon]|nr:polyprenyl synthetase family protein [Thermoplasmatales archaeon]
MGHQSHDLDTFYKTIKNDLEKKITTTISDKQIIYVMEDGKRLRPLLASLSFKACTRGNETSQQYQKALEGSLCIELAYTVSIIHEDIIEKSKKRRGRAAFHVKESIDNAILFSHKILTVGFDIALNHGEDIARLYADSWDETLSGELGEIDFNKGDMKSSKEMSTESVIFNEYIKIIDQKTAALFSSACKAGAMEADMAGDILKVFADYGREIGLAYQLADDLVDLMKGKKINNAIMPLINKLEDKIKTVSLKKKTDKKTSNKYSSEIEQFFICEIKRHVTKAEELSKSALIPSSKYKNFLNEAPSYLVNNVLKEIKLEV